MSYKAKALIVVCQCLFLMASYTYSQGTITANGKKYLSYDKFYHQKYIENYRFADPSGNITGLEKFKGKFVYLSLYFIGCVNCDVQFPYENELIERFARYDSSVVFVNLCVLPSSKEEDWPAFISKHNLHGYNLIMPDTLAKRLGKSKIYRDLKTDGFPTYIILGRDGRILGYDVPEPGSGVIIAYMLSNLSSGIKPTLLVPRLDQEFKTAAIHPDKSLRFRTWIQEFYGLEFNEFTRLLNEKKIR